MHSYSMFTFSSTSSADLRLYVVRQKDDLVPTLNAIHSDLTIEENTLTYLYVKIERNFTLSKKDLAHLVPIVQG